MKESMIFTVGDLVEYSDGWYLILSPVIIGVRRWHFYDVIAFGNGSHENAIGWAYLKRLHLESTERRAIVRLDGSVE